MVVSPEAKRPAMAKAMAMRWSPWLLKLGAFEFAAATNDHAILLFLDVRAHEFEVVGHDGQPVAFLDPQFLRVADDRFTLSQCPRHGDDGDLIDNVRHLGSSITVPRRRLPLMSMTPQGSPCVDHLDHFANARTMRISTSMMPVRVGLRPTFLIRRREPGWAAAATSQKAALEISPGTLKSRDSSDCHTFQRHPAFLGTAVAIRADFSSCSLTRKYSSIRSVWSRLTDGSMTVVVPLA